jgi:hypothetical protein
LISPISPLLFFVSSLWLWLWLWFQVEKIQNPK